MQTVTPTQNCTIIVDLICRFAADFAKYYIAHGVEESGYQDGVVHAIQKYAEQNQHEATNSSHYEYCRSALINNWIVYQKVITRTDYHCSLTDIQRIAR